MTPIIIRCALKVGHGGDCLWITATMPARLGECAQQSATSTPRADALKPFVEVAQAATLAAQLWQAIDPVGVPFAALPLDERHRLIRTATAAIRAHSPEADDVAVWRAAQVLGLMRFGKEWDGLSDPQQRACRVEASACVSAYTLHLQGMSPDYVERRAVRARAEAQAKTAARRLATKDGAETFSCAVRDLGHALAREQAAKVVGRITPSEPWGVEIAGEAS